MKEFFNEFKQFIKKGNVVDMAVGVIIVSAFSAIINFFIIAFTLFIIVKVIMGSRKALNDAKEKIEGEYKLTRADYKSAKKEKVSK